MKKLVNSEIQNLTPFLKGMPRSKKQIHGLNESDCEILKLSTKLFLASSIDSVSEEWVYQLYKNPETLAWLSVQGTLSDLVACGVKPEGFLFSPLWSLADAPGKREIVKKIIFETIQKSLKKSKVPLLGGDQGEAASLSMTGVAFGVSHKKPLTRIGMKPGDYLCTVGEMGIGPALGFRYLLGFPETDLPEESYRPVAELQLAETLLKYAGAAIDTSDGFCSALHQLSVLNGVAFDFDFSKLRLSTLATNFCRSHDLPALSLCYGEHGDYQVLFSVSEKNIKAVQKKVKKLQLLGRVRPKKEKKHRIFMDGKNAYFDPSLLAHYPKNNLESLREAFDFMLKSIRQMEFKDV